MHRWPPFVNDGSAVPWGGRPHTILPPGTGRWHRECLLTAQAAHGSRAPKGPWDTSWTFQGASTKRGIGP
jgi:hypothetical protein